MGQFGITEKFLASIMHHIESAYILAGGRSSRFGKNKAMVDIGGLPLVLKLARELSQSGLNVSLVAQSEQDYASMGLRTIPDGVDHAGPLAGIGAALRDGARAGKAWCLVTSCDILEWRSEWIMQLQDVAAHNSKANAVIFQRAVFSPFPGIYRTKLADVAQELLESGKSSVKAFHEAIGSVCHCPVVAGKEPRSFNSPEELAKLLGQEAQREA